MPNKLRCPSCGESGEIGRRQRGFEPRGSWEDTDHPVLRCINCGCGLVIRPRRLARGARVEQIDLDVWGRMEYTWGRENPLPATEVPAMPSAAELVRQFQETHGPAPADHLVHLIAEAAEVSDSEVRRLLAPPSAS
jgi:hypothetical protein